MISPESRGMNTFTRTLISTIPLLCATGVLAAPAAAHPGAETPVTPVCGAAAVASERHGAAAPPRGDATPAPVPVRVTVRDLTTAAGPAGDRGRAAPVEVEIVVRGGGSAAELPAALRDLVQTLITPQRVPAPRPHR